MREIKFRVWDLVEEEMLYEEDMDNFAFDYQGDVYFHLFKVTRFVPLQYIECKDSYNKPIYEGDILEIYAPNFSSNPNKEHFVLRKFFEESLYVREIVKHCERCEEDGEVDYIKVVGNIYDNPELLSK